MQRWKPGQSAPLAATTLFEDRPTESVKTEFASADINRTLRALAVKEAAL